MMRGGGGSESIRERDEEINKKRKREVEKKRERI